MLRPARPTRVLLAIFTLPSVVILGIVALVEASAPNDKCCIPAMAVNPSKPVGADDQCGFDKGKCVNTGLKTLCNGEFAWQVAAPGYCEKETGKTCTTGAKTNVTITRGAWLCVGDPCVCVWVAGKGDGTTDVVKNVDTCYGDGCTKVGP